MKRYIAFVFLQAARAARHETGAYPASLFVSSMTIGAPQMQRSAAGSVVDRRNSFERVEESLRKSLLHFNSKHATLRIEELNISFCHYQAVR